MQRSVSFFCRVSDTVNLSWLLKLMYFDKLLNLQDSEVLQMRVVNRYVYRNCDERMKKKPLPFFPSLEKMDSCTQCSAAVSALQQLQRGSNVYQWLHNHSPHQERGAKSITALNSPLSRYFVVANRNWIGFFSLRRWSQFLFFSFFS